MNTRLLATTSILILAPMSSTFAVGSTTFLSQIGMQTADIIQTNANFAQVGTLLTNFTQQNGLSSVATSSTSCRATPARQSR